MHCIVYHYDFCLSLRRILRHNALLILSYALCFISIPLAVDPQFSLLRLAYSIAILGSILCFCIQYSATRRHSIKTDIHQLIMFISVFYCLVLAIFAVMTETMFQAIPNLRNAIQATYLIHPNTLSSFLSLLLIWVTGFILYQKPGKIHYLIWIALAIALYSLFSRSVIIMTILCLVFLLSSQFIFKRTIQSILTAVGIFFIMTCVILYFLIYDQQLYGFLNYLSRDGNIDNIYTLSNRIILWDYLINSMDVKIFLLGHGYSVIDRGFGVNFGTGILYGAHNAYLSVLLGNGILCFAAFIGFLSFMMYTAIRHISVNRSSICFAIALFLFLLDSLFSEEIGVTVTLSFALIIIAYNLLYLKHGPEHAHTLHRI